MTPLPYIDTHSVEVSLAPEQVWDGIEGLLPRLGGPLAKSYARLVGCVDSDMPPIGFHVTESTRPTSLVLAGRHRFSRYELRFRIEPKTGGSSLHAETRAEFPGLLGRAYRAAVIRSGAHRIITRRLVRLLGRRAEREQVR